MDFNQLFSQYKQKALWGRYISPDMIRPLISRDSEVIGRSVLGQEIHAIKIGNGSVRILAWSQMHGNEGTTTKAIFDLICFLASNDHNARSLCETFSLYVVPMLNPDGAAVYTRENANGIDLNRDFNTLTQPESRALMDYFEKVKPHYCFNLHDQRSLYGVGDTGKSAAMAFLAPSFDIDRNWNAARKRSADIIVAINNDLQKIIPGQVARFDDGFNINCCGDTFQSRNIPTVLFEAGQYRDDYQREKTREFVFASYLSALNYIEKTTELNNENTDYLNIPQNKFNFNDFVYKNVKINYDGNEIITNFAAHYCEALSSGVITFKAVISDTFTGDKIFGHKAYDANGEAFSSASGAFPKAGEIADFYIGTVRFVNGEPN